MKALFQIDVCNDCPCFEILHFKSYCRNHAFGGVSRKIVSETNKIPDWCPLLSPFNIINCELQFKDYNESVRVYINRPMFKRIVDNRK